MTKPNDRDPNSPATQRAVQRIQRSQPIEIHLPDPAIDGAGSFNAATGERIDPRPPFLRRKPE